jgi:hypothetical protein
LTENQAKTLVVGDRLRLTGSLRSTGSVEAISAVIIWVRWDSGALCTYHPRAMEHLQLDPQGQSKREKPGTTSTPEHQ